VQLDGPGIDSRWWPDVSHPYRPALGALTASYKMGNGSLCRGLSGRGMALTTHPLLAPRLKKENSYYCTSNLCPILRVKFTFNIYKILRNCVHQKLMIREINREGLEQKRF